MAHSHYKHHTHSSPLSDSECCESCSSNCYPDQHCCHCSLCGITGPTGPAGLINTDYAQFIFNDRIPSFTDIPLFPNFQSGDKANLISPTTIELQPGYIYQISYTVQGTPGNESSFQIIPYINSFAQVFYASTGVSNTASNGNGHAAATFITNAASSSAATLTFRFTTPVVDSVGVLGTISIEVIASTT